MNDPALFGMLGLLIGGAGVWAVMSVKLSAARLDMIEWKATAARSDEARMEAEDEADENWALFSEQTAKRADAFLAHSRLSDAHNATKERIERALEQITPGANATVKRMAAILTGER